MEYRKDSMKGILRLTYVELQKVEDRLKEEEARQPRREHTISTLKSMRASIWKRIRWLEGER